MTTVRVERLGEGTPEVAVVGGVHGDEPCGWRAIERLLAADPDVDRPVKLVVANERAIERGVRYVDEDLNRAFPGDPEGDTHETRLAAELAREIAGCTTLALHSTQSHPDPFAIVHRIDDFARVVVPQLSTVAAVDTGPMVEGRLFSAASALEVECGLQGTETAAENGYRLVREFLAAVGALGSPVATDGDRDPTGEVPVFRLRRPIPKPGPGPHEVFVENFQPVAAGERFATADGDPVVAEEPFVPVLVSANGYDDVYGYAADRVGTLA